MTTWEVVLNWVMDGTVAQNVLHYQDESPVTIDWEAFATVIRDDIVTHAQTYLVPSITFTGITVREDVLGSVGQTYAPAAGDLAGTSTDDTYARVLAMLVRKLANSTQRPNAGRIYQAGISSKHLTAAGEWSQNSREAFRDLYSDMVTVSIVTGGDFAMVIKASNPAAPNTVDYNPVNVCRAQTIPATQRRRRIGVGIQSQYTGIDIFSQQYYTLNTENGYTQF